VLSQKNPVTGAISLIPQTISGSVLQPAKEVLHYTDFGSFIGNPIAWQLIALVFIQVIFVTMVYGPIAAYLVEAFPAKIRYTALSLPYHIGNEYWRTASGNRFRYSGGNRKYLCRLYPDNSCDYFIVGSLYLGNA
jgi:hypothetical protein